MTISVWRYSHLALAVSSFLFIALAAITGCILAFQPATEKAAPYHTTNLDQLTLAQTLPSIRKTYPGVTDLTVDVNGFVSIKGDAHGQKIAAYIDPRTGKLLGKITKPNEFFQWVTGLHRSLFLHETGRFFVGLTAFLLLLITVSGTVLVIQRQRGIRNFFKKIVKEDFAQYYHVILGRISLLIIVVISLSGAYLSLARFGFFPDKKIKLQVNTDAIKSGPELKPAEFAVFKQNTLADVQTVQFPFSDFPEDYYTLKLKDRELAVNQFTGETLSNVPYPTVTLMTNLALTLHTGRSSVVWALVLAAASVNILFFIYSGFAITLKRRKNIGQKNQYGAADSEVVILVGSENGSTFLYASKIHQQLLSHGKRSYITELNNYTVFPQAEQLLIMTSTYGLGDAPTNANRFAKLLAKHPQTQKISYSVLAFGSHAYPDFCRFGFETASLLSHEEWAAPLIDIHTVNDQAPDDIRLWAEAWSQQTGISLNLQPEKQGSTSNQLKQLKVISSETSSTGDTFLLRLKAGSRPKVSSGDLLAVYPANDHRERLYSIGVIDQVIQLSVRLHPQGLGSTFLHQLKAGQKLKARIVPNPHFHFPDQAPAVVMIANGTGMAPFLGMIAGNLYKTPLHVYGGFRDSASFALYQTLLNDYRALGKFSNLQTAFSREGEKQYVSDLIRKDGALMAQLLSSGGVIMICGSLAMQQDVLLLLESICSTNTEQPLSYYQSRGQLLMDCY